MAVTKTLSDIAPVIRSKNAGPTMLTIDVFFEDAEGFRKGLEALTEGVVAARYGIDESHVKIEPYRPAFALKITIPRGFPAGSPGDRDVYGAQQHVPLLGLPI